MSIRKMLAGMSTWLSDMFCLMFTRGEHPWAEVIEKVGHRLQEGDIVCTQLNNGIGRRIARATGCWATHVGILFKDESGWYVMESGFPFSRRTSLVNFLKKTKDAKFSVLRMSSGLTPADICALKTAAEARMGLLYNPGFDYNGVGQFCSKFVYQCYRSIGIELGLKESLKAILARGSLVDIAIWRAIRFGIVGSPDTITPAAIFRSAKLKTVIGIRERVL